MRKVYESGQTIFIVQYSPVNRAYIFNRYDGGYCYENRIIQDKTEALDLFNSKVDFYKTVKGLK